MTQLFNSSFCLIRVPFFGGFFLHSHAAVWLSHQHPAQPDIFWCSCFSRGAFSMLGCYSGGKQQVSPPPPRPSCSSVRASVHAAGVCRQAPSTPSLISPFVRLLGGCEALCFPSTVRAPHSVPNMSKSSSLLLLPPVLFRIDRDIYQCLLSFCSPSLFCMESAFFVEHFIQSHR